MPRYKIGLFGSAGIRSLEYDDDFMNDQFAVSWVERNLKYYYPIYYSAALWKDPDGSPILIAEFNSQVTVSVTDRIKDSGR